MLYYVIRRLLVAIPVLIASSIVVFVLVAFSGDPLGDVRRPGTPEFVIQAREHQLWLDRPLPQRYWHWLSNFVTGNFGLSTKGINVREDLFRRFGVTMRMVVLAIVVAAVLAIVIGVVSAVRQYSFIDYAFTFLGFLFLSMPVFWLAGLLKEIIALKFNDAVGSNVISTIGDATPDYSGNFLGRVGDYAGHLVLPTIALAAITYAGWSRYQRASMLDVLDSDYVRLARAKGLRRGTVMRRHALRTALIPTVTVIALDTGSILGGAIITEKVFAWHGMGEMLVDSANDVDLNRILAVLMISALFVIIANLVADVLYAVLDPRIRYA